MFTPNLKVDQNTKPIKMEMFPIDLDVAEAQLDLSSWLFQDDIYVQQDFCEGAKDSNSFSVGRQDSIPHNDYNDFSWMDDFNSIHWTKPCKLEDLFPVDNKQDSLFETSDDKKLTFDHGSPNSISQSEEVIDQQFHEQKDVQSPFGLASPEQSINFCNNLNPQSPPVISVPITDALKQDTSAEDIFMEDPDEERKRYHNTAASSGLTIRPSIALQSQSTAQQCHPFVINVKKVSIPSKPFMNQTMAAESSILPERYSPTLKEAVQSSEYDSLIDEFLQPKEDSSMSPSSIGCIEVDLSEDHEEIQESSCVTFIAEQSDSGDEDSSCILLSPASSSGSDYLDNYHYLSDYTEEKSKSVKKTRSSPYSAQERKLRKKEQNRRAALRYRQKKKNEEGCIQELLEIEEKKHEALKEEYGSVFAELKMMKKLMRDVLLQGKQSTSGTSHA